MQSTHFVAARHATCLYAQEQAVQCSLQVTHFSQRGEHEIESDSHARSAGDGK